MPAGISGDYWTATSTTDSAVDRLDLFAIAAPGLEPVLERELDAFGIHGLRRERGGVEFTGGHEAIYLANLHARTASRIIARVAEFGVRGFPELVKQTRHQPWERYLDPARPVRLRVTCRKSRLYHSGAVAERVAEGIEKRVGASRIETIKGDKEEEPSDGQLVIIRIAHDRCLLSVDTSGELLHRRGYREATAKAPIRETLAAALVLAAEWRVETPLLDPFCGSGTIAIEGAMLARRIAPGLHRRFAFMGWPEFDEALWRRVHADAVSAVLPRAPAPIHGSDRDQGAVESSRANAERAGVADDIAFEERALSAVQPPPAPGWVCTNPPYGIRVSGRAELRNLYAQLGKVLRARFTGWNVAMFSADARLERATRLALRPVLRTVNGGIPVRIVQTWITEGSNRGAASSLTLQRNASPPPGNALASEMNEDRDREEARRAAEA